MSFNFGAPPNQKLAGKKFGSIQRFTPEQMQLWRQMFSQVGPDSYTGRMAGGDPSLFEEIEAPAMQQFAGLQGNLASRFSGMGSGARRSSGFQNTSNAAASDFAQQLQSQRQGLQRQAIQDLRGMSNDLLGQSPYQQQEYEPRRGWKKFLGGALPLAGAGIGGLFGGPAGAYLGGRIGSAAGQGFA